MENFVVSARKYRPATFNTVVGQSSITTTLKNAIRNNHLAQAFLFCGPRGVGKTTCARILAKTINCFNPTENTEACDKCDSCVSFNSGHSLNVYELDAASNNSVDDIRSLVDQVRFAPQLGNFKVYIIDEVHMLSTAAFNAFLKTLEEPPKHAIFILATTEKHKIIPTILSRCQIFDFNRIRIEDIASHLAFIAGSEGVQADEDALHIIAQKADGALRDACSIFDQIVSFTGNHITYRAVIDNLNVLDYDYYFRVTDAIMEENISSSLLIFNEILNHGFDGHHFITGLGEHFRNLLVCKDVATLELLEVGASIKDKYKEQAQKCPVMLLLSGLNLINKCDLSYKASKNQRLQVELALMQLCKLSAHQAAEKKNDSPQQPKQELKTTAQPTPVQVTEKKEVTPLAVSPSAQVQATSTIEKTVASVVTPAPVIDEKTPFNEINTSNPPKKPVLKTSTPSINTIIKKENKVMEANEPSIDLSKLSKFTEADLEAAWNDYAKIINQKGKMQLNASLTSNKPILIDETTIQVTLENKSQEDIINEEKTDLLIYLRERLKKNAISLVSVVNKDEGPKRLYTAQDKFKRMAEKNPDLNKLKQQFDLEIDF